MTLNSFEELQKLYPWPNDRPVPVEAAFEWSLDGGGRHLMDAIFAQRSIDCMLEVGSFMGGSALQWLRKNNKLKLICVDPWPDNLAAYVRKLTSTGWALKLFPKEDLQRYAEILAKYGTLQVVQNNLWHFRHRVVMIRGRAQELYPSLANRLAPDLIFVDALKAHDEFTGASRGFPDAVIAGDDWTWLNEAGEFPVRGFVAEIAQERGGEIFADRQTFVVSEKRHGLNFESKYRYELQK